MTWKLWTQDAAEELEEGSSAWLCWQGTIQECPYTWLYDENGEGYWFTASIGGDERIVSGISHYQPLRAPKVSPTAKGEANDQ